ncbi:putative ankyrin repeat protein RF_0381 [Haliotis rubra]|uniref:putative ankyrin repeat protein RF_0381 n=1 Tax=Haliotis rubra TaxID=36100 RepID=UPI001EE5DB3F|nr:putative ankyrin repeat protein RF_0381 [Haliotis rubra]
MDGDINRVKCIIFDGRVEINVRGLQRKTPVMIAAEKAHKHVFDFLVRKGADLSLVDAESNTILHLACEGGNLDIIETVLVQDTVDINSLGGQDRTPAMKAAVKGHKHVFDLLVTKGADLSLVDGDRNTILHMACEGGNLDIVKHILTRNTVNINSLGENDWTPAMKAAIKGHKDVFDLIVKEGADLSLVDEEGDSILHAACEGGNVDIVTYMLKQNSVTINLRGEDMFTPVMMAASKGHIDVFNVLVRENADLLIRDSNQNSILHIACKGGNMEIIKSTLTNFSMDVNDIGKEGMTPVMLAASEGRKDMFDFLLQNGADLSHADKHRNNILHRTCQGGNMELVKYVLAQNIVKINSRSDDGSSPAMEAAHAGHIEVLKLLVSEGADLTFLTEDKDNILHVALQSKHMDTVKYVLTNDFVEIDSRNIHGMTAVMLAAEGGTEKGHSEIVKYILTENAVNINDRDSEGMTPVLLAADYGYGDIIELLESKGADLSVVDDSGENILHKLSLVGQVDLVNHVLKKKSIVRNINKRGVRYRTPVMTAACCGYKEVFDVLVKNGADLTLIDDDGNSILHLACEETVDIVKYLLSNNIVDIDSRGYLDRTPVLIAAARGNRGVFELLMKQGADMLLVDDDGNNILHLAVKGENVDLVKHILENRIVDIKAENSHGLNATEIAKENNRKSVYIFLLSQGFGLK